MGMGMGSAYVLTRATLGYDRDSAQLRRSGWLVGDIYIKEISTVLLVKYMSCVIQKGGGVWCFMFVP